MLFCAKFVEHWVWAYPGCVGHLLADGEQESDWKEDYWFFWELRYFFVLLLHLFYVCEFLRSVQVVVHDCDYKPWVADCIKSEQLEIIHRKRPNEPSDSKTPMNILQPQRQVIPLEAINRWQIDANFSKGTSNRLKIYTDSLQIKILYNPKTDRRGSKQSSSNT